MTAMNWINEVRVGANNNETLAAKAAEQALSDVLAVLPAGLVMLDKRGKVSQANSSAIAILGKPLLHEPWFSVVQRAFAPRSDDGHEVSLRDGRRVSLSISSLSEGAGQLILLQDLTETRRLQEQLARHERLSSMGHMVASLAHQLRTPLSTALLYAGHLQKDNLEPEQQKKFAARIKGRLQHMDQQIRDMLIFAKGETRMARRMQVLEFMQSLQEAIQPVVERNQLNFKWEVGLLEGELVISPDSLIGAVLNLINNAVEAVNPAPKITLHLEVVDDLPGLDGRHLVLCVADDGPGIDTGQVQKAQEPFYTTKSQGTGLGLAIVQAVIEAHQGRFWLQTSLGEGVRAWLALPAGADIKNKVVTEPKEDSGVN